MNERENSFKQKKDLKIVKKWIILIIFSVFSIHKTFNEWQMMFLFIYI